MSKFSLKDFFGNSISKVLDSLGNSIDKVVTNKEEKEAAKKAVTDTLLAYQVKLDDSVTERLKIDMQSDNKLSKIVRPASLIYTTLIISALAFVDGNFGIHLNVDEAYITLFKSLMLLQYGFYFGSRGMEKVISKIYSSNK